VGVQRADWALSEQLAVPVTLVHLNEQTDQVRHNFQGTRHLS
jgi:hypothetical protein